MRRWFYLPVLCLLVFRGPSRVALADARRWCEIQKMPFRGALSVLALFRQQEFRSLFYYRYGRAGALPKFCTWLCRILYRPMPTLYLATREIGEGLYILHGFATIIAAKRLGKNCWVNQQVTIGHLHWDEGPVLEDGVRVYAGAKVLGEITIGANTRIGANAVVLKSAPSDCTLAGVPARIVRRAGERVDQAL